MIDRRQSHSSRPQLRMKTRENNKAQNNGQFNNCPVLLRSAQATVATGPALAAFCAHAAPWSPQCIDNTTPLHGVPINPICENFCDKQAVACGGWTNPAASYANPFYVGADYSNPFGGVSVSLNALQQCVIECSIQPFSASLPFVSGAANGDTLNCRYSHIQSMFMSGSTDLGPF